ncbi:serine/threonine-protein kinase sepA-like [Dorcoceras hygrometricum]|uniref:Serine/threonine-protein kinase sepA-like n=1 Tax=Dorcoceras hygrometricum TaxID=472368 RepID=A0A2Z7CD88_9LAMI|nr:serine/threonine-protein kinase sepA-like [Dorcoceras hygrometricum]
MRSSTSHAGNTPQPELKKGNLARDSDQSECDLRHEKRSNASHAGSLKERHPAHSGGHSSRLYPLIFLELYCAEVQNR